MPPPISLRTLRMGTTTSNNNVEAGGGSCRVGRRTDDTVLFGLPVAAVIVIPLFFATFLQAPPPSLAAFLRNFFCAKDLDSLGLDISSCVLSANGVRSKVGTGVSGMGDLGVSGISLPSDESSSGDLSSGVNIPSSSSSLSTSSSSSSPSSSNSYASTLLKVLLVKPSNRTGTTKSSCPSCKNSCDDVIWWWWWWWWWYFDSHTCRSNIFGNGRMALD